MSGGLAEYFGVDPTIVRLATFAAFFTGVGILVYLAAWVIIPLRPDGVVEPLRLGRAASERRMNLAFGVGAIAIAIGVATGSWTVLALALVAGGVWLLSEQAEPAASFAPAAQPTTQPVGASVAPGAPTAPPPWPSPAISVGPGYPQPPTVQYAEPPRPRTPQRITWIVLSLLALLAALGIAAASGDWWDVSATRFLGVGVVIIGVGVVAGQIRGGGARGLIPLGILAALALVPVAAVDGLIDEGVGEASYRPSTAADLLTSYEHGVGELIVDLSDIDFEGRSDSIDIDLGIGELIVIVSEETGGQAVLHADAGEVSHQRPNRNSFTFEEGINVETDRVRLRGDAGDIELNINVGLGTAQLRVEES